MDVVPPSPDDIATICYTSGTTGKELGRRVALLTGQSANLLFISAGNPKGVIITHGNMVSNLAGAYIQLVSVRERERETEREEEKERVREDL